MKADTEPWSGARRGEAVNAVPQEFARQDEAAERPRRNDVSHRSLAQKGAFANGSDDPRFAAERFEDRVDRHADVICDRGDGGRCIPVAQEAVLGSNEDSLPVLAGPLSAKAGVVGSPGLERPYLLYNRH